MKTSLLREQLVRKIVSDLNVGDMLEAKRFETGMAHYVYDVTTRDDRLVVRLTKPEQQKEFESAIYWYHRLKPMGVPLPRIRMSDCEGVNYGVPVMVLDRLPGTDLRHVYGEMTDVQKACLAKEIVAAQDKVRQLEPAKGFGYARTYEDNNLYESWAGVMDHYMERIVGRNEKTKLISQQYIERLSCLYETYEGYFKEVRPMAFLDDTTIKNVIIDRGSLSGIVDVDFVCFGDRLLVLGLTKMGLLDLQLDVAYIEFWSELWKLTMVEKQIVNLYAGMFGLEFISAMGHQFNRETESAIDWDSLHLRLGIFESLTEGL